MQEEISRLVFHRDKLVYLTRGGPNRKRRLNLRTVRDFLPPSTVAETVVPVTAAIRLSRRGMQRSRSGVIPTSIHVFKDTNHEHAQDQRCLL
jgi:hypothetical protein